MKPKDKAVELIDKFVCLDIDFPYIDTKDGRCIGSGYMTYKSAVKCAVIAADEILLTVDQGFPTAFWSQVRMELQNLNRKNK